jgi:hypothetical protein
MRPDQERHIHSDNRVLSRHADDRRRRPPVLNPMGLFVERLVSFRRRPGGSPLAPGALVALALVVVLVSLIVVIVIAA